MILKTLEITNFGIFKGTHKLSFKGKEVVGIMAEYASDKTRSNRSGKSLVMEAIRYNLTGLTRAKKESQLIHHGEKMMEVKAVYTHDGKDYVIRRGRDIKNTGVLELDWIQKTTASQEKIESLFGIYKDDFDLTNFFKQSDINGFMEKSPTDKTKFLMKWLDNEHWKNKEKLAKADRDETKSKLIQNEAVKQALETSLEIDDDLKLEAEEIEKSIGEQRKGEKKLRSDLDKLKESKTKTIARKRELKERVAQLLTEFNSQQKKHNEKVELKKKRTKYLLDKDELSTKLVDTKYVYEVVVADIAELKAGIRTGETKLQDLKDSKGICPILGTTCTDIKPSAKVIKEHEQAIIKGENALGGARKDLAKHKSNMAIQKDIDRNKAKMKNIDSRIEGMDINFNREEMEEEISEVTKKSKMSTDKLDHKIEEIEDKLDEISEEITASNNKLTSHKLRIKQAEEALEKINEVEKRSRKLRRKLQIQNYVVMMFGKNGIPADEIDNSFQKIEDNINFVLNSLDPSLSASFQAEKTIDKWEPICHCGFKYPKGFRGTMCDDCNSPRQKQKRDEISLKILENGVETDFALDSGGGKTIISYAVRIALTILKREECGSKLDMLFLDEVDTALDSHLAAQIVNNITKLLTKQLGYGQILLVSHKDEIKKAVPDILKVIRHKSSSVVEFE